MMVIEKINIHEKKECPGWDETLKKKKVTVRSI